MGKGLTQKYTGLSKKMDEIINEANSEIDTLQSRIDGMQSACKRNVLPTNHHSALCVDQKSLQDKNAQLVNLVKVKDGKRKQVQVLYDKLKQQVMMGQVKTAASETVSATLGSLDARARQDAHDVSGLPSLDNARVAGIRGQPTEYAFDPGHRFEAMHTKQRVGHGSHHSTDLMLMPPPGRPIAAHRTRKYLHQAVNAAKNRRAWR